MARMPARPSRIERQAYRWVARMIDDPQRHEAALLRWIGSDNDRLAVYNRVAAATKVATWSANQIYERRDRELPRPSRPLGSAWAMALVVLGIAATAIGIAHLVAPARQPDILIPPAEAYEAPAGAPRTITLADGSTIDLRPGSRIDARYSRSERRLFLTRGSARFNVAHNASWPFTVLAGGGSVTARGTVFEVAIGQDVAVNLIEGAIDVTLPRPATGQPVVRHLTTGGTMRFQSESSHESAVSTSETPAAAERIAMKSFDDVPLRDVIAEINRQSAVQIELADPRAGTRRVVLDLHAGDVDDVADGIAGYLGLTVDRSRAGILLLR